MFFLYLYITEEGGWGSHFFWNISLACPPVSQRNKQIGQVGQIWVTHPTQIDCKKRIRNADKFVKFNEHLFSHNSVTQNILVLSKFAYIKTCLKIFPFCLETKMAKFTSVHINPRAICIWIGSLTYTNFRSNEIYNMRK